MKKALGLIASLAAVVAMPQNAYAYTYCTGPVYDLDVALDGKVSVNAGFNTTEINMVVCNLSTSMTLAAPNNNVTISADTCRGWYSSMLATQLANKEFQIVISEATCAGMVDATGNSTKTIVYYRFNP